MSKHDDTAPARELIDVLTRLADDCACDDARALGAPWTWTDETLLWNVEADHCVLNHGGTQWPVTSENREVIAAARNRLPELARVLRAARAEIERLQPVHSDAASRWSSSVPNSRVIAGVLRQLAGDCAGDYTRMMKGPWAYDDTEAEIRVGVGRTGDLVASGGSVGYENARMTIEANDGAAITSSRNRLPDLIRMLREAAECLDSLEEQRRDHAHLRRQYAESRDYVATLVGEVSDLGAVAQRHVDEANQADARIVELETALAEALTIAEWEASEYRGLREHRARLVALRAVLGRKDRPA